MQGYDPLHDSLADPIGFYGIQVWRKCRPLHLRYPSLQPAVSLMMRPQGAGALSVHEDETRPVLLTQRHNNWINDVIQVVLACHSTVTRCRQFCID